jgi:PAS domain S-box-containing protein
MGTAKQKGTKKNTSADEKIKHFFMQTPAAIAILEGPKHIFTLANPLYQKLFTRTESQLLGKPILEVFPEIEEQGLLAILDNVFQTGEPFKGYEFQAKFYEEGKLNTSYYDFVIHPIRNEDDQITDIILQLVEVAERVQARLKTEESEKRYHNIIHSSPSAIAVLKGREMVVTIANDACLEIWGKEKNIIGHSLYTTMPEIMTEGVRDILQQVYDTGSPYFGHEMPVQISRHGKIYNYYFDFVYQPQYDATGAIEGVAVIGTEVTPHALLHKKISENEKQLSHLANAMPQLVWMADANGKITYYNDRIAEFAGVIKRANGTWNDIRMIHPQDARATINEWQNSVSKEVAFEKEHRLFMKDGSYRWHLSRAFPQRNEQGQVIKWFGTATDIHEQKMISEQLKDSEQHFRLLADMLPQMVWMARPDGFTEYYNKRWYEYTGIREITGGDESFTPILHPDDVERTLATWYRSIETEADYEIEYRFADNSNPGTYRWFLGRAVPVRDSKGKIVKWFGTCTDIDDQKNFTQRLERLVAERTTQLMHEKDFVETILNSTNDIIAVVDTELRYVSGNARMEENYGVTKEQYVGKRIVDVFPVIEKSEFYNDLKTCLEGNKITQRAYKSKVVSRWYQNTMVPLREKDGRVYGVVIVGHDITDVMEITEQIQEVNEALQQKNRELERTNKELESFNYIASHDLQEPLRKIQTFIELLQASEEDKETTELFYRKIKTSAKRMSQLIRSVLSYSKISSTKDDFGPTDLNEVLENVKSDFELLIHEKGAVITSQPLPVIHGIPIQLHQLFSNLISNSLKFVKTSPVIRIESREVVAGEDLPETLAPGRQYIQLTFIDNGIGFEQQFSEHIFHLFQRLHGKDKYTGTGIGLSIVKKIVEHHHGAVIADSKPDQGACFRIWLPVSSSETP